MVMRVHKPRRHHSSGGVYNSVDLGVAGVKIMPDGPDNATINQQISALQFAARCVHRYDDIGVFLQW
jgi:hypothetical protein